MDDSKIIISYDIASGPPIRAYAANPWKTRYVLNFKGTPYRTEWVAIPDDRSLFYTLPIIKDIPTGETIGDSFEIALYLDKTYTNNGSPPLFSSSSVGLQAAFNAHVDALFTGFILLCTDGISLNPATAETKVSFLWRFRKEEWEDLTVRGDARGPMLEALKAALSELAKVYRRTEGLFLEGENLIYADFIVGAWLACYKATLPPKEWEDLQTWHDSL
ncbi:hypothetical protein BDN70DRAFT_912641 [Pholiota conissans]|uniref:GST N-terminal domain-containing protein n=1 Tax=Pholiota conissans TaxID=109636 RepID=A0A9P5Z4N5_9AGAR|nr:hypothetical protein BDN70DRAFT_912641 [Pholiota conissans]